MFSPASTPHSPSTPPSKRPKMAANPDRDHLDQFLWEYNLSHPTIRQSGHNPYDNPVLPSVAIFAEGSWAKAIPSREYLNQVVIFGTISPGIFHDLLWECVQTLPEYTQLLAGVYEVEKEPALRFLVHFRGFDYNIKYYQSIELVREYGERTCDDQEFLTTYCSRDVRNLVLRIDAQTGLFEHFRQPTIRYTYYLCRAWASLHGVLNEKMEDEIQQILSAGSATKDEIDQLDYRDCHPVMYKLLRWAQTERLEEVPDRLWLQKLQNMERTPLSERIGATHYLAINIMHTGCSNLQSTKWIQYVESRLPRLEEMLKSKIEVQSFESDEKSFKKGNSKMDGNFEDKIWWSDDSASSSNDYQRLNALLDATDYLTNERIDSPFPQGLREESVESINRLGDADSDEGTDVIETGLLTPKEAEFQGDEQDAHESRKEVNLVSYEHNIRQIMEPTVFQWPNRLVHSGTDPKAQDYEGAYLFGLRLGDVGEILEVETAIGKWIESVKRHETSLRGNCFIWPTLQLSLEFKQWEIQTGGLKPCNRILFRSFIPPPAPLELSPSVELSPFPAPKHKALSLRPNEPTPRLRPASDILNRLRHDASRYDIDEYFIGYEDRFSAEIVEARAGTWVKETTHESFIPESRVRYFKRRWGDGQEEIMWDRGLKIDRVFGSGVVEGGRNAANEQAGEMNPLRRSKRKA